MKKLHLAVSKDDLRPALMHIQVKDGFVYATNCHILVKFPINEVFGENSGITETDHFYIDGKQWGKFKFHSANLFVYSNGILMAMDRKGNNLGMIKTISFDDLNGRYPDCNAVLPSETKEKVALDQISFNHELYYNLIEVFNLDTPLFNMNFFGKSSIIMVKPNIEETTKAIALIMPVAII